MKLAAARIALAFVLCSSSVVGGSLQNGAAPVSAATPSGCVLTNLGSFPASCQFYSASSPWRTPVGPNPAYMSDSAGIIAHLLNGKNGDPNLATSHVIAPYDPFVDDGMPYYVGTASDPGVRIRFRKAGECYQPNGSIEGTVVHIPADAKSRQQSFPHGDQHLIVLDQSGPAPIEYDFYQDRNSRPLRDGMSFDVGCAVRGDPYGGDGWRTSDVRGGTATAAGNLSLGSVIRISELQAGLYGIHHALSMQSACTYGAHVPPARIDGGPVRCNDTPRPAAIAQTPPMGAHYWWDEDCPTIAARTTIGAPAKAVLCALHTYGGFETDTNDNSSGLSISFAPESPTRYVSLGHPDLVESYMVRHVPNTGFSCHEGHAGTCYQLDLVKLTAREVVTHLHILQPPRA